MLPQARKRKPNDVLKTIYHVKITNPKTMNVVKYILLKNNGPMTGILDKTGASKRETPFNDTFNIL